MLASDGIIEGAGCSSAAEQGVLISIRFVQVRDDSQTAEFLTADYADNADKGRKISDYPRHLRHQRLTALADPLVAAPSRVGKFPG
jgi:hypothetical protein